MKKFWGWLHKNISHLDLTHKLISIIVGGIVIGGALWAWLFPSLISDGPAPIVTPTPQPIVTLTPRPTSTPKPKPTPTVMPEAERYYQSGLRHLGLGELLDAKRDIGTAAKMDRKSYKFCRDYAKVCAQYCSWLKETQKTVDRSLVEEWLKAEMQFGTTIPSDSSFAKMRKENMNNVKDIIGILNRKGERL